MGVEVVDHHLAAPDAPVVAIAAHYKCVEPALRYEEELHDVGFDTEWIIEPERLKELASLAQPGGLSSAEGIPRHPYSYSAAYRGAIEKLFKDSAFQESRIKIIQEADVVLGVNKLSSASLQDILHPEVLDALVLARAFGKVAVISEAFPTVYRESVGSIAHGRHLERNMQLNGLGVRRAKGNMAKVRRLYEESVASREAKNDT